MSRSRWLIVVIVAASAGAGAAGCKTTVVQPVEVTSAPYDVEAYPHTVYDGHVVYYRGSRWYYQDPKGNWHYYKSEPKPLYEYRRSYIEPGAPPY